MSSGVMTSSKVYTDRFVFCLCCSQYEICMNFGLQAMNALNSWQWDYRVLVRGFTCIIQLFPLPR